MFLQKRNEKRWCTLRPLLLFVLAVSIFDVSASSININIQQRDEDWPWKPQLDLYVPEFFFTGERELRDVDQWRVLSQVGAPLRIASDSTYDLMQLLELVNFMRNDGNGQCPYYTTPYRRMYYWFHPDELTLLYGEARWAALQRLQEPKAWSLVLKETVGPSVREAERLLLHLNNVDPPGQLILHLKEKEIGTPELRVPLADFRVDVRVIRVGHDMEYRLPQLTVDGEARQKRRHVHYFLQAKQQASDQVAEFDAATVRAQNQLRTSLMELQREEQDAYDRNVYFKERYQHFLMERQARRLAAEEALNATGKVDLLDKKSKKGSSRGSSASLSSVNIHIAAPQVRTSEERHASSCRRIYAAWDTLRRSGVRWEQDRRVEQLRRLHTRHECTDDLPLLQCVLDNAPAKKENDGTTAELQPTARQLWLTSVAEMMAQHEKSGQPPTIAQLYAVLFAVWKAEEADNNETLLRRSDSSTNIKGNRKEKEQVHAAAEAAGDISNEDFSAANFIRFVDRFVESGDAVAMAGGWLPRFVRAELQYAVGILDLVTHHHLNSVTALNANATAAQNYSTEAAGVATGVVHLYESLSGGSHHAAGTLATMREHGIFARQHTKAAMVLLLRSMQSAPSHLLRELLLRTPSSNFSGRSSVAVYRDASRLLRFEQFYAVDHTFSEVDDPFMTRAGVTTLVAVSNENIHSTDEAPELEDVYREAEMERSEGNYEGSITIRLSRRVLKANMLFTGFKDTKRDPHEAQCELLVVLRRLGYFCDLDVPSLFPAERTPNGRSKYLETTIGIPLPDSCPEHDKEIYNVLGNTRHTLLTCPGTNSTAEGTHPRVQVPTSETLFGMLQQVLLSLSYVHLLHTHQYELSHLYAALSMEMSLRLQHTLVKRWGLLRWVGHVFTNVVNGSHGNSKRAALKPYEALETLARGTGEEAWAANTLLDDIEGGIEDKRKEAPKPAPSLDARVIRVIERCRSVADSPFINTEALLLLALSRWAERGTLVSGTMEANDVEQRLSTWTMEPFQLLSSLLHATYASKQQAKQDETRRRIEEEKVKKLTQSTLVNNVMANDAMFLSHRRDTVPTPAPLDVHALFLICLSAMKRWKRDFSDVHLLDSTSYSVRRTDPFVLASFLLHAQDAARQAPLISIPKLRAIAAAASPHFLGSIPHFLPLVDDTVETYAARLLRFAARHIHPLEPSAELLRSGSYGVGFTMDKATSASMLGLQRRNVIDDASPRRFRLRTLRRVKQQTLEAADLQPLLYASDAHEYFNQSRWTYLGTALNAAYNALLYPFTLTTSESVLTRMQKRLQFIAPEERAEALQTFLTEMESKEGAHMECERKDTPLEAGASGTPGGHQQTSSQTFVVNATTNGETNSVSSFVEAFAQSAALREHFIACLLFSFTLESGMPEGFSLVFYEASDRDNPYLRDLADFLADSVFGRWTASVWTEHHLSAQWQREKRGLLIDGSVFTLNTRSPFRYASMEGRQELFARLSRWKAAKAVATADAAATKLRGVSEARDELLWCSGFLTRKAYYGSAQVYPYAYEGALYPAADLECLAELIQFIASQGRDTGTRTEWSAAQSRQAQRNGTELLRDLGNRLAYDYDLIDRPPPRRFARSESEFSSNVSDLPTATEFTERQQTHRNRFARVSTQLVEPWNRRSREISVESLDYGEGAYYNSRLHRVSGYRWGSMIRSWWLWFRHLFP